MSHSEWITGTRPDFEALIRVGTCGQLPGATPGTPKFLHHVSPGVFVLATAPHLTTEQRASCGSSTPSKQGSTAPDQMATLGPKLWREIHETALHGTEDQWRALLDGLPARLPCGECRTEYRACARQNPPPLAPAEVRWLWSHRLHNSVSRKKGLPEMDEAEARALYA